MDTYFTTPQDSAYLIATTGGILFLFGLITCLEFAWYTLPMVVMGGLMGCAPWWGWLLEVLEKSKSIFVRRLELCRELDGEGREL